jgi:hypothetical protein
VSVTRGTSGQAGVEKQRTRTGEEQGGQDETRNGTEYEVRTVENMDDLDGSFFVDLG